MPRGVLAVHPLRLLPCAARHEPWIPTLAPWRIACYWVWVGWGRGGDIWGWALLLPPNPVPPGASLPPTHRWIMLLGFTRYVCCLLAGWQGGGAGVVESSVQAGHPG
jgi:hypothetical protein